MKGSRSNYCKVPYLVMCYTTYHKDIYNAKVYVHEKHYGIFRIVEDDLRELGATPVEYTKTVLNMLKNWAHDKGLKSVPIRVFCGDWAFNKFKKVYKSDTIDISNNGVDGILHSELLVARAYINGEGLSMDEVVTGLTPLLSDDWLELYRGGRYRFVTGDVLDILCEELGVNYASSYEQLRIVSSGKY